MIPNKIRRQRVPLNGESKRRSIADPIDKNGIGPRQYAHSGSAPAPPPLYNTNRAFEIKFRFLVFISTSSTRWTNYVFRRLVSSSYMAYMKFTPRRILLGLFCVRGVILLGPRFARGVTFRVFPRYNYTQSCDCIFQPPPSSIWAHKSAWLFKG